MFHTIVRNVLLLFIFSISEFTIASAAENRVALVIGNSAYQHAPVLNNPRNDASDIAAAAEKLGFKVITGLDLDKSGMDRTIRRFSEELKGGTIGVFFYAGHGLQVSGRNYLVPVDAQLKTTDALDFEMVGLDVVQRVMEAASETNVLFVDACRDNPLSRNLARAMGTRSIAIGNGLVAQEAGAGTLISYSTQPGNTALDGAGRNSPYAGALAKHITTQGMDLSALLILVRRDVLAATAKRQVPWEHSALTAQLMLAPEAPLRTSAIAAPEAPPAPAKAKEEPRSDAKPKAEIDKTAELAPQTARQSVIKAKKPGVVTLANSLHEQSLYDEAGTHRLMMGLRDRKELPEGKYHLQDGSTFHMSTKLFEVKSGQTIDINQISGILTVKSFEIKAGETLDINQVSGFLTLKGAKKRQHIYDETGTKRLTTFPFDDGVHLPPGRYRVIDNETNLTTAEALDIKAGEEVVIDFGG